ncbi:GNAT family N-acetyltransferase [Clostridium tagluense]|uniref:GNAT family N-acetyltransferase n=1 Tax=Clostridium tagluense TaxID=360422 RepID=UPI001CF14A8F|nr:GNAT family N-acetyltransferase [Clostridium tagluense]MCB2296905.1 GNAT family N-acetyltransferase [Clostridium tagluense]
MEDLKLVEYNNSYAKAIADMWRKSSEGWNGNWATETEESVLKSHESSTDLNTYLAVKGEEIVGYCGLSKYEYDDNTLYVRLLNVRYDLHGTGIGRTLVCKSIERTTELAWPRIDLYTWPGNTKSLPLYKRCGFFLEKRDDSTHLMNFIPGVVNGLAFKEYFENVHWYKDLKRTINMEPDGIEENGFIYYEYLWGKEEKTLRVQFENKSRGITLIETEDYLIKANMDDQKLILGGKYKIKYEVINKSKKPLNIKVKGIDDKNIKYSFSAEIEVIDKEIIEGEFLVNEPEKKVGQFNTYPSVVSEILINGKEVEFKIGVDAQYPGSLSLKVPRKECYKNLNSVMYLDIKNNYKQAVTFELELVENKNIKFVNKSLSIPMEASERKSVKLQYILNNFNFYNEVVQVKTKLENGKEIVFKKELTSALKGKEGRFGGKTEEFYIAINGVYSAKLNEENKISIQAFGIHERGSNICYPMLGRPFSEEFSNASPREIEHYEENEKIVLKTTFVSETYKNIRIESILKLSQNGIAEQHYEVYNDGMDETISEICLSQNLFMQLTKAILPLKGKFIESTDSSSEWIEDFNLDDLTENWIYARNTGESLGLCWHSELQAKSNGWEIVFEHELGKMKAKEKRVTKPVFMALDTFRDWKAFRDFALEKSDTNNLVLSNSLGMMVNDGNPFVKENFTVKISQYEACCLDGEYSISSKNKNFEKISNSVSKEEKTFETEFTPSLSHAIDRDILNLEIDTDNIYSEENKMIFKIKNNFCESKIIQEQGHRVYSVSNGVMEIKACDTFSHVLYSLKYNNHEWLENSFPTPRPKSWFNPWFGGIGTLPEDLSFRSVLEENIQADFVSIEDNFKNKWQGIKVKLHVKNNENYKGLEVNQYYLMLPGIPVLCHTVEIVQNTGKLINYEAFEGFSFFNFDENPKNNWIKLKNLKGTFDKYKVGGEGMDILATSSLLYGTNNLKDKIQLYSNQDESRNYGFVNLNDTAALNSRHITLEDGSVSFTSPDFYIFTEEYIEDEFLKDLRNIKF